MEIVLAGNPNCGKTTLFNALTGQHQRVGNWPGVTVEKKVGYFDLEDKHYVITDLPGVYSLTSLGLSQDERIMTEALATLKFDLIINVIDATSLERQLYLTSQLMELNKPLIVVINMIDLAKERGIEIDINALAQHLKCPVIAVSALHKAGLEQLKQTTKNPNVPGKNWALALDNSLTAFISKTQDYFNKQKINVSNYHILRFFEGDYYLQQDENFKNLIPSINDKNYDLALADARYEAIHQIVLDVQHSKQQSQDHLTAKLDRIVLNRFAALPIFFSMMYCMFFFAINIGGAFQDFFDILSHGLFVEGSASLLNALHAPSFLTVIIAHGLGMGLNTTITFIPVLACMYFFLAFLESSGYMARAAFVVDKFMRLLGLPGKAFVPMIVGFGCNVPAIMAARTLDSEQDRLLTVLMSPFMSCSARLAIYTVFVAAFFPQHGQNIVFSLYLIGILMAVLTGYLLRKTTFNHQSSPLILEPPTYHKPSLKRLLKETYRRLYFFIVRAGRIILPVCLLLGVLNALTIDGHLSLESAADSQSILSWLGHALTPLFHPLGIHNDNWPATVGLLLGTLAKEVVVGSLNALYTQLNHLNQLSISNFDFLKIAQEALLTIPHNLAALTQAIFNPVAAIAPENEMNQSVYGLMMNYFDGRAGAFAYLLFILLYIPCVSTIAAIRQEANRSLMWFSIAWSSLIAYASAVIFYQAARFQVHPQQSIGWITFMILLILAFIKGMQGCNFKRSHYALSGA